MNLRGHKTLRIGGGFCVAILIAELIVFGRAGVRFSASKTAWEETNRELTRLLSRDVYPSAENVRVLEDNLDALEYQIGERAGELNRDPFPMGDVEAAEFSARTQGVIERFHEKAALAGIQLPKQAEVGFAAYASGGAVPEACHVPRLMRQLYSAERVANVLVESGVASISRMTRDIFENEPARRPRERNARDIQRSGRHASEAEASEAGKAGLYFVERIGMTFTADEAGVWRVLAGFNQAPHFMTVAAFGHKTESDILSYSPAAVKAGRDSDDETLKYLAGGFLTGKGALSRSERIITGNELVEVHLVVDVYNFNLRDGVQ